MNLLLIIVACLAALTAALIFASNVNHAPDGNEDSKGFHVVKAKRQGTRNHLGTRPPHDTHHFPFHDGSDYTRPT